MARSLKLLIATTMSLALLLMVLSFRYPRFPQLAAWVGLVLASGAFVAFTPSLSGLAERARWLVGINAILMALALWTTQLAAGRANSATHLRYVGLHVAGIDTVTIGVGDPQADIHLQTISAAQTPWSIRATRVGERWFVAPVGERWFVAPIEGVEQLRMVPLGARSSKTSYDVAGAAVLEHDGGWVAIAGPDGRIADTLRFTHGTLTTSAGDTFALHPIDLALSARYLRRLRDGMTLASLDGSRPRPQVYERFVRIQRIDDGNVVNGVGLGFEQRVLSHLTGGVRRLLVSATPPFRLAGPNVSDAPVAVTDSALLEARSADGVWRFTLRVSRREPSAPLGLSLLFVQSPRPLETPLPTGATCLPKVACGVLSLARLPSPIAHVSLGDAGFDHDRFGLLARVEQTTHGFAVVLPDTAYTIQRGAAHATAIPVTMIEGPGPHILRRPAPSYWVLLGASGTFGDDAWRVVILGLALGALLIGLYGLVSATANSAPRVRLAHERWLALGVTTLLGFLLARLILGARVAFFAPFNDRTITTAVGLWVAIAVVTIVLLSWPRWVPPLLLASRAFVAGRAMPWRNGGAAAIGERAQGFRASLSVTSIVLVAALALLMSVVPGAVVRGLGAGAAVSLAWLAVAWLVAFTGPYFETFELGPWSIVEQLPPTRRLASESTLPRAGVVGRIDAALRTMPELALVATCLAAGLAHLAGWLGLLGAGACIVWALFQVWRRRHDRAPHGAPDLVALLLGIAVFSALIACLKILSENGSMGVFILLIFVALAGVRIGRTVGSRLTERSDRSGPRRFLDALLLLAPVFLLLPIGVIDMGLFLVVVLPVGVATWLAAGPGAVRGWSFVPALGIALLAMLGRSVIFAPVEPIRGAESHAAQAAAFDRLSSFAGFHPPGGIGRAMDRAAARLVATRDEDLAQRLLVSAHPGPARDLLMPSIEQIWGERAYAQAGLFGEGLGQAVVGGRGVAETVSYAENTFAVYVLGEHGAVGGLAVLVLYLLLLIVVGWLAVAGEAERPAAYRASRALFIVAALLITVPAIYVALSNLGVVPITGQNMPFLGLNAWSDVALCAGVVGILITGAIRGAEEA